MGRQSMSWTGAWFSGGAPRLAAWLDGRKVQSGAKVLTVLFAGYIVAEWVFVATHPDALARELGGDFTDYRNAALRWVSGGSFYESWQLAGPYQIVAGAILYPPPILILLIPFLVLPAPLWWILPIGTTVLVTMSHRPRQWAWPLLLLPFTFAYTNWLLVNGTPTIWIVAFVALATRVPSVGALVLMKPSVFPFALLGIGDRRWWAIAFVLGLISLPMATDYLRVLLNSDGTVFYSLRDVPLLAVPLIARLGASRPGH